MCVFVEASAERFTICGPRLPYLFITWHRDAFQLYNLIFDHCGAGIPFRPPSAVRGGPHRGMVLRSGVQVVESPPMHARLIPVVFWEDRRPKSLSSHPVLCTEQARVSSQVLGLVSSTMALVCVGYLVCTRRTNRSFKASVQQTGVYR